MDKFLPNSDIRTVWRPIMIICALTWCSSRKYHPPQGKPLKIWRGRWSSKGDILKGMYGYFLEPHIHVN